MRIIKQGKIKSNPETIVECHKCDTEFAYTRSDTQTDPRNETYVKCPTCKAFISA